MAAMFVVKNNSLSLHWELYFTQILRKKIYIVLTTNMSALSRGEIEELNRSI